MGRKRKALGLGAIILAFSIFYQQIYLVLLSLFDVLSTLGNYQIPLEAYGILALIFVITSIIVLVKYRWS